MAKTKVDARLNNRTNRAKLEPRREPYWLVMEQGRSLGYRQGKKGGTWIAKLYNADQEPRQKMKALGPADDSSDADGIMVFNFSQAQEKAREWFEVAHQAPVSGQAQSQPNATVWAVVEAFLRDRERQAHSTVKQTRKRFEAWVQPALGDLDAGQLTKDQIENWMTQIAKAPTRRGGREGEAPGTDDETRARKATVNRIWASFRAALNFGVAEKLIPDSSGWARVKSFSKVAVARIRFLSQDEQVRLVEACDTLDFRRLVQGGLFTGAREGELVRLVARDFNESNGSVFIEKSKTGRPRHIILSDEAVRFFREITEGKPLDARIFPRTTYRKGRVASDPEKWDYSVVMEKMNKACATAKVETLVFHELRHTYASTLINAGVPMLFVAEQLGHANTKMVEQHYGHLCQSAKAESIRKLAPQLGIHTSVGGRVLVSN